MKTLIIDRTNITSLKAGGTCPVLSEPVGGKVLVLLPDETSCTMEVDTMRHDGPAGAYITFTTPDAIALAEYERTRGH